MINTNEKDKREQIIKKDSNIIEVPEDVNDTSKNTKKKKGGKKQDGQKSMYSTDTSASSPLKDVGNEIIQNNADKFEPTYLKNKDNINNEFNNDERITVQYNKHTCSRLMPVIFIFAVMLGIYFIYIMYHCLPLLVEKQAKVYIYYDYNKGIREVIFFHIMLVMYLINYILSIVVLPGSIPDTEDWALKISPEQYPNDTEYMLLEKKKSGERRYCKWCCKYKPDRTHHCRVCRTCVLKMDHHCPWIYNCVGYNNHKYFMLSLIYCCITTIFVSLTMFPTVRSAIKHDETPFNDLFLLLFGETLNSLLALIVTCFLGFHIWLMARGMTTIEFCEKQTNYHNQSYAKYYNKGLWHNFKDIFGESPFFWLLPIDDRAGDGINFKKVCKDGETAIAEDEVVPIKYDC